MFKDEDSVIGYELINEPWAGDVIVNPLLLIPSVADRYNLEPFYYKIQKKLREVDDQHIIFYESVTFDDFFPVGFSKNPGGENYRNRSSLSYHYYSDVNFNINWLSGAICSSWPWYKRKFFNCLFE
jgi:endoglycosylceramidase